MKFFVWTFHLLLGAALLGGCGKDETAESPSPTTTPPSPTEPTGDDSTRETDAGPERLFGLDYEVVRSDTLEGTEKQLSGNGAIVFATPLARSGNTYDLDFNLEEKGSLKLHANSNAKLERGLEVKLTRKDEGLGLAVTAPEGQSQDLSDKIQDVDVADRLHLIVESHESGKRGTVWINGQSAEFSVKQGGQGVRWGLTLENATVMGAEILPLDPEDGEEESPVEPPDQPTPQDETEDEGDPSNEGNENNNNDEGEDTNTERNNRNTDNSGS